MNPPKSIVIALGSNEGDRLKLLQEAVNEIYVHLGQVKKVSGVYETPAWGFSGNDFLNACLLVEVRFEAEEVLRLLLEIESRLGRKPREKQVYANRPVDLDLLFFENEQINTSNLQVPHPEIAGRRFVLVPLNDLDPQYKHPVTGKRIKEMLQETTDTSEIRKIDEDLKIPGNLSFSRYNYVAVEGNIGAGKTSFSSMVSQDFNAKLILERFKDNPFLPKFYEDQGRYAFPLEMSFLADRYQQLSDDLAQYDLFKDFVISDYDVFKSLIFAKITLHEDEYALYQKLFHLMYKELVKPDLYVYLYQNTDRLLENIKKRGRDYEQNIEQEYLANINKSYLSFIKSQPALNVKIIDISDMDFVNSRQDYLKLLGEIF